jgi:hypothetical protein
MAARSATPGRWLAAAAVAALLLAPSPHSVAQTTRDHAIPTCYEQLHEYQPHATLGDLTVLIDQTTYMDARLRQIVRESVDRLIEPGTRLSIATFSAYMQGRYLDVQIAGDVELPIDAHQRDFVPKRELRQNDQCLADQLTFARRLAAKTLDAAFTASDPNIARSDILAALHDIGERLNETPVAPKTVILVSDMLENSSITSFYQGSRLRAIDPQAELKKVATAGIQADFIGARVYVIGAGAVSEKSADARSYRDPRAMLALEDFWRRWFAASHAEVVEFGKPMPLVEIRWNTPGTASGGPRVALTSGEPSH